MAEQRSNSKGSNRNGGSRGKRLTAREAVEAVRREFPSLLGRPIEEVLGVQKDDDGNWMVMVQVVELERVPRTTDVLGAYAVELDGDGDLIGYRRRRRYTRAQTDED